MNQELKLFLDKHIQEDTDTSTMSVFPLPCGVGKSEYIKYLIADALINQYGLIVLTDVVDRLNGYMVSHQDEQLTEYISRNEKQISILNSANVAAEIKTLVFKPVILKSGDTIIFDSVSRMSRNADEGFNEYEKLYNDNITLIFIKEPHINTDTYRQAITQELTLTGNEIADEYIKATNRVLMILAKQQIKLAFEQAEKEVQDLHKRTSEGIQTAKMNGKQIGRQKGATIETKKSIAAKKKILKHSIDFGGTLNDKEVMCMIGGIARNTYYKYKKELKKG